MNDLISIIVPVYNVEKYIDKCIDSLIKQTYKNIEIIIIDDGSTDNSSEIVANYKDKRIKVIHKKNGGLSSARNCGIKESHGKYIGFIDSDDYISYDMFEILYKNIIETKSDISMCDFVTTTSDAIFTTTNNYRIITKTESINELLLNKITSHTWNKLYKKDLFKSINFPLNRIYEDIATTYKLFDKAKKIVITDSKLYAYIQRTNSICGSINTKKLNDFVLGLTERYNYLINNKYIKYNMYYNVIVLTYMISKNNMIELLSNKTYIDFYKKYFNRLNFKLPFKYFISSLIIKINPKLFYKIISKGK